MSRIYFVYQKYSKQTFKTGFLSTKSPFELTKVIMESKIWYAMFVLKLSGIQILIFVAFFYNMDYGGLFKNSLKYPNRN